MILVCRSRSPAWVSVYGNVSMVMGSLVQVCAPLVKFFVVFRRTFRVFKQKTKRNLARARHSLSIPSESVSKKGYKRQDKTHHTHSSDLRLDCCPVPPKTYIFNLLFICTKFLYGVWCVYIVVRGTNYRSPAGTRVQFGKNWKKQPLNSFNALGYQVHGHLLRPPTLQPHLD